MTCITCGEKCNSIKNNHIENNNVCSCSNCSASVPMSFCHSALITLIKRSICSFQFITFKHETNSPERMFLSVIYFNFYSLPRELKTVTSSDPAAFKKNSSSYLRKTLKFTWLDNSSKELIGQRNKGQRHRSVLMSTESKMLSSPGTKPASLILQPFRTFSLLLLGKFLLSVDWMTFKSGLLHSLYTFSNSCYNQTLLHC